MKALRSLSVVFLLLGFFSTPVLAGFCPVANYRNDAVLPFATQSPAGKTTINLNPGDGIFSNPQGLVAFKRAAAQWSSVLKDPVVLNIKIDMAPMGSGILGSARASQWYSDYYTIRKAMKIGDSGSPAEAATLKYLPTEKQFKVTVPDGYTMNGYMTATRANLLALGFSQEVLGGYGRPDGNITFSTKFRWDYDNSDGIDPGSYDFESVAVHEIGHILGFVSEVDYADAMLKKGSTNIDLMPTPLDLFRFSSDEIPTNSKEFRKNSRMLTPGGQQYFYYGSGAIQMSTGSYNGDGHQASHWKDNLSLGIMDPTFYSGETGYITANDVIAMDLIGWEAVPISEVAPEPGTLGLIAFGWFALACRRTKRHAADPR